MPVVVQGQAAECGLACMAMVLGAYERAWDLPSLRRRFPELGAGCSLRQLSELADQLGFASRGLRTEPCWLRDLKLPAILHWGMDHFVVLVAVGRRSCVVHDPAVGRVRRDWRQMGNHFSGLALELWPGEGPTHESLGPPPRRARRPALITQPLRAASAQLVSVGVLALILQALVLAAPWHLQWLLDDALPSGDEPLIRALGIGFAMLVVLRVVTQGLHGLSVLYLGHLLGFKFAHGLLGHVLRLPSVWFERQQLGNVGAHFESLQALREGATQVIATVLADVVVVFLSLVFLCAYHPTLAAYVVAVHAGYAVLLAALAHRSQGLATAVVAARAAEHSHILQLLQNITAIKRLSLAHQQMQRWQQVHTEALRQGLTLQRRQLLLDLLGVTVAGLELAAVVSMSSLQVASGELTVGMMIAFLTYRGHFAAHLHSLSQQALRWSMLRAHLERVDEVWQTPAERQLTVPMPQADQTPVRIRLQQVSLRRHSNQAWLLRQVDLSIPAGAFIAVTGASGCGKSSLLLLLMGQLEPQSGRFCLAAQDLYGASCQLLRRQSASVMQDERLFSGSLLDNIAMFDVPDLARVANCLALVGLTRVIAALPMGVHTPVGLIGQTMSGGQLQSLFLARALYRRPAYLYLDEITANLDRRRAQQITTVVSSLRCTRVVATHDMRLAARADRVLAMKDGRLVNITGRLKVD